MKCPICQDVNLFMNKRQGAEINYCPYCPQYRGIWLDRGKLDWLIKGVGRAAGPREPSPARTDMDDPPRRTEHEREHGHHCDDERYRQRRKSFLGETFDFD